MGVSGQRHAPAALPPGKTPYALYRGLVRPYGRSGWVQKIWLSPWIDPQTVCSVVITISVSVTMTDFLESFIIQIITKYTACVR